MDNTLTRAAERFPADLERIRGHLKLPSVSATGEGIREVAEATGAWIEGAAAVRERAGDWGGPAVDLHSSEQAWIASPVWALGRTGPPDPLAPWCAPHYVSDRILGLPWASGGVGHAAGAHGPDEYVTLAALEEHVVGAAAFLLADADLPR